MARTKARTTFDLSARFKPLFWHDADQRSTVVRECRRQYAQLKEDAGAESYQQDILCQRAVFIALRLQTMEVEAATNGEFDSGIYSNLTNTLLGILKALGLEKKNNTQTLQAYVKRKVS